MIRFRPAALIAGAIASCAAACLPAFAGDALEVMPPLEEALPWTDTPQGVKTTAPLLLNPTTIVPPGSVIRVFYIRPSAGGDASDGPKLVTGNSSRDDAYSRPGGNTSAADSAAKKSLNDIDLAVRAAHQTVWPNIASFRAALALLGSSDLRLVYQTPATTDLSDQALIPVEGLLLSENDHAVVVSGVVQRSNASRVGFVAGDRIEALNGGTLDGLTTFVGLYDQAHTASTISKPKSFVFRVRHVGADAPVDIAIRPPPALGGSLLDQ